MTVVDIINMSEHVEKGKYNPKYIEDDDDGDATKYTK